MPSASQMRTPERSFAGPARRNAEIAGMSISATVRSAPEPRSMDSFFAPIAVTMPSTRSPLRSSTTSSSAAIGMPAPAKTTAWIPAVSIGMAAHHGDDHAAASPTSPMPPGIRWPSDITSTPESPARISPVPSATSARTSATDGGRSSGDTMPIEPSGPIDSIDCENSTTVGGRARSRILGSSNAGLRGCPSSNGFGCCAGAGAQQEATIRATAMAALRSVVRACITSGRSAGSASASA